VSILGAVILSASGLLAGLSAAAALRERERQTSSLCRMLELMIFELERFSTPLPELFSSLEKRTDSAAARLCGRMAALLGRDGVTARRAWRFACEPLAEPERSALLPLGEILGCYGAREQTEALRSALSDVRRIEGDRRRAAEEKSRLYMGLMTAGGILAAVLLW